MIWKITISSIVFLLTICSTQAEELPNLKQVARQFAPHAKQIDDYAWWVYTYSKKHQVDPYLMLALIKVESDFDQQALSNTGDYSLAQINYKVWKKELSRKGISLNFYKLKTNYAYAIDKMGLILKILETRHGKKDPYWYARYHSNTKKHKTAYLKKIKTQMAILKSLSSPPKRTIAQD